MYQSNTYNADFDNFNILNNDIRLLRIFQVFAIIQFAKISHFQEFGLKYITYNNNQHKLYLDNFNISKNNFKNKVHSQFLHISIIIKI